MGPRDGRFLEKKNLLPLQVSVPTVQQVDYPLYRLSYPGRWRHYPSSEHFWLFIQFHHSYII